MNTMKTKSCYYNEDQILKSGLFSPERMAEISAAIDSRISSAFDGQGKELTCAKLVDLGSEGRTLFINLDQRNNAEYMRRTIVAHVLTDVELALVNHRCLSASATRQEAERFEKAEKLTAWDGFVFWGDEYAASVEEMIERFDDEEEEWPEYVWATAPSAVLSPVTVADIFEHQICDRGWEDMDTSDLSGDAAALQAALDRFVEENAGVCSYYPDYKKAVLLAGWKKGAAAK